MVFVALLCEAPTVLMSGGTEDGAPQTLTHEPPLMGFLLCAAQTVIGEARGAPARNARLLPYCPGL